jgi:hypothetical protein
MTTRERVENGGRQSDFLSQMGLGVVPSKGNDGEEYSTRSADRRSGLKSGGRRITLVKEYYTADPASISGDMKVGGAAAAAGEGRE